MANNNNGGAHSQMDSLIQMNDLQQLIKDFNRSESAISGLHTLGSGSTPGLAAEKLYSILQNASFSSPIARGEGVRPSVQEGGFNIGDIVSMISGGKEYKDEHSPGWDTPQINGGLGIRPGAGGGMQPEKNKGIMGLLQRLLPGGKTGYR